MTATPVITHHDNGRDGRYVVQLAPGAEAELTWYERTPGVVVFDHTYVPPAFRGHDAALRLVERGIADARAAGLKIVPQCPYVAVQFRRHPDWSDVLASS